MRRGDALGGVRERTARGTAAPRLARHSQFTLGMLSAVAELFPSTLFSTGEMKSTHGATRMMHRRSMTLMGGHSNRPSMTLHRQRMARSGNLVRRRLCGKVRHTCLLIVRSTEDFCLGIEMVLNYNLTLSNDTTALYVTG